MSTKPFNIDLFFTEESLFQPFNAEIMEILPNQDSIIDSQFGICSQTVRLQLFSKALKLTFLTWKKKNPPVSLFLILDYTIKAVQLNQKLDGSCMKNIGFSLFKEQSLSYDFYATETEITNRWMKELSKLIFLSGFSNHFKALKYLGRGQFAQVWEVERLKDRTKFAAKIVDKEICYGQVNGRQAIYNEIQILKKLNHPNIVHLECVYESEKSLFIILEQIKGFPFSEIIRKKGSQQETQSSGKIEKIHNVNIMKNLLKAVQYLHSIGIAHRDIKPGNIIINPQNWMPYIIDFGLSEFYSKQEYLFQICGSPGYMAPQIFTNPNIHDLTKCDVFSLGAIFYMLLTNQPLFYGNSTEQIIEQTKNTKSIIKKKLKLLHGDEAKLLQGMLQQNPQKRLSAAQALNHQYFLQAMFEFLKEIRKPNSEEDATSKYSVKQKNLKSKFQELFSESIIFIENKFNFIKQEEKQNINLSQNIVEPSQNFSQKIKRRSLRYMSEENIDTTMRRDENAYKLGWSGKWRNFKTLEKLLMPGNFWPVKDFNLIF